MTTWRRLKSAVVLGVAFASLAVAEQSFGQQVTLSKDIIEQTINIGAKAADDSFKISNAGDSSAAFAITDNATWIQCSPTGGNVATGGSKDVTVKFAGTENLTVTATGTITVKANGVIIGIIQVTITVVHPQLFISGLSDTPFCADCNVRKMPAGNHYINYLGEAVDTPNFLDFKISNVGNGELSYAIEVSYKAYKNTDFRSLDINKTDVEWLSFAPATGSGIKHGDDPVKVTVSYASTTLPDGVYKADVIIHNTATDDYNGSGGNPPEPRRFTVMLTIHGGWIRVSGCYYGEQADGNYLGELFAAVGEQPIGPTGGAWDQVKVALLSEEVNEVVDADSAQATHRGPITCALTNVSEDQRWFSLPKTEATVGFRYNRSDDEHRSQNGGSGAIIVPFDLSATAIPTGEYSGVVNLKDPYSAHNKYTTNAGVNVNFNLHVGVPEIAVTTDTQSWSCLVAGRPGKDADGNRYANTIELFAAWPGDAATYTDPIAENLSSFGSDSEYQGSRSFKVTNVGNGPLRYHIETEYHDADYTGWITNAIELSEKKILLFRRNTPMLPYGAERFNYADQIDLDIDTVTKRFPTGTYTATLSVVSDNVNPCESKKILVVLRVGPKVYIQNDDDAVNGVTRDANGPAINLSCSVGESPAPSRVAITLPGKTSPGIDPLSGNDSERFPTFCPSIVGNPNFVAKGYPADANSNLLNYSLQRGGYQAGTWMSFDTDSGTLNSPGDTAIVKVTYDTSNLAEGTYIGYVFVNGTNYLGEPAANTAFIYSDPADPTIAPDPIKDGNYVKVNLQVVRPTINVDPASFTRTIVQGTADPTNDSLSICNRYANGTLYYSLGVEYLTAQSGWLSVTDSDTQHSSTGPEDANAIAIAYDTSGLKTGTHSANVVIGSTNASNAPFKVRVDLIVLGPSLAVQPASLTPSCAMGMVPTTSNSFKVWNSGNATLRFNVTCASTGDWLSCSPTSGTSTGTDDVKTVGVTYNVTQLTSGTYTGTITVTNADDGTKRLIPVQLTIVGPEIALNATSIEVTRLAGDQTDTTRAFNVWNANTTTGSTLRFSAASDASWMTADPDSGVSEGPTDIEKITLTFKTAALDVGVYGANVTISAPGAAADKKVSVKLTIERPTLTVSAPGPGETWSLGSTRSVQWASTAGGTFRVDLYKNGTLLKNLATGVTGTSYNWTIPLNLATGADYSIKVASETITLSDMSAAFSLVVGDYLSLVAPNGGEEWAKDTAHDIVWQSNLGGSVTLEYSADSGADWTAIADSELNDGVYSWNTSSMAEGTAYRVRVTSNENPIFTAASAGNFTIVFVNVVNVVSPNGGEQWTAGATHAVEWTSNAGGTVDIDLLKGDLVAAALAEGVPNSGFFQWTISSALAVGTDYKVRVSSVQKPEAVGTSAAPFSLITPYLTLVAPTESDIWQIRETYNVVWLNHGVEGDVKLELLKGGRIAEFIAPTVPAAAEIYSWEVPETLASGNDYKVKITSLNNPLVSVTGAAFAIVGGCPAIVVTPAELSLTLLRNQTAVRQLAISNIGDWPLTWSIDAAYVKKDSNDPDGPTYSWREISDSGTKIAGLGDDTNVGPFPIGFSFPFYGNNCASFRVCSNGWLSFSSAATDALNQPLPSAVAPRDLVAFFWDDLDFTLGGDAYYKLDNGDMIVEFKNVSRAKGGAVTCEVILKPSGEVLFQYAALSAVNACTVGVQNAAGDKGVQVCYNQNYLTDNLAVRVSPYWPTPSAVSGAVDPGETTNVNLTFSAAGLAAGIYQTALVIANNDPNANPMEIPVDLLVLDQSLEVSDDVNGDGMSDLIFRSNANGALYIDLMDGKEIDNSGFLYRYGENWEPAGSGDLNKDGNSDIVLKNTANGAFYAFLMNGLTSTGKGFLCRDADAAWNVRDVVDLDGDGAKDIVLRHAGSGAVYAWLMNGLEIKAQGYLYDGVESGWDVAGLADLNGDGAKDLVLRNADTGALYVRLLDGVDCRDEGYIWTGGAADWKTVGFGKLNADLKDDIVFRNVATGDIYAYLMNGTRVLDGDFVWNAVGKTNWKFAALADFDGDSKADILLRDDLSGALYLFLMDGARPATQGYVWKGGDPNWEFAKSGDFNGDGKADILLTRDTDGAGYMYLMNGLNVIDSGMVWRDAPEWKLR